MVDAKTEGWIEIAQRGFENWKAKPHNARWFRKIDGTPIPNDLTICIGEAFAEPLRSLSLAGEDAAGLCERLEKRAAFWERYWTGRSLQDPDSGPIREAAAMIRSLSLRVEAEKRAREEAERANALVKELAALTVPENADDRPCDDTWEDANTLWGFIQQAKAIVGGSDENSN